MRILEHLKNYDDNLTVSELRKQIEDSAQKKKLKENKEFKTLKDKYKNSYLKRVRNCQFFGKVLEVYYIGEITERAMTEEWKFVYGAKGFKISFSKINFSLKEVKPSDHFSPKELKEMTVITEDEYRNYRDIHSEFEMELSKLLEE